MLSLKDRLKEILLKSHFITAHQINEAIGIQERTGGRFSDIIVEAKFIKKSYLLLVLGEELKLPTIDLDRLKIDSKTAKIISVDVAFRYQIIPLYLIDDVLTLAMSDPLDIFVVEKIKAFSEFKINPLIFSSGQIRRAIELYYEDAGQAMLEALVKESGETDVKYVYEEKEILPSHEELDRMDSQASATKITNKILEDAVKKRASDILIEPQEKRLRIRCRVDGALQETDAPGKSFYPSILSRIKIMSNLNIAEHRFPQDGRFKTAVTERPIDFRVSIIPSTQGEKVAIRILDRSGAMLDIEKLGFSPDVVSRLSSAAKLPHGMLLVCGPTGSGKTTTLYSILEYVDSPEKNIVTVEDPVEFQLEGINQVTAKPEIKLTFAAALRSILRQDPNIIMIGEIRDCETADIAIKSALTGHLVLSTLHTTTASGSIIRLINMGVEPYLINASLICVLAQRLVRKICSNCKESYILKKEILEKMDFKIEGIEKFEFFRGKGCSECLNSGYVGRVGIAEILLLSPEMHQLIVRRSPEHEIKEQACREGMRTLREEGLDIALKGITSLEEILRVTESD